MTSLAVLMVEADGQWFGVPIAQIASVAPVGPEDSAFGACLGVRAVSGAPAAALHRETLVGKTGGRWTIDRAGDLRQLPVGAIRRLPSAFARRTTRAFFGAALDGDEILLLVDLERVSLFA